MMRIAFLRLCRRGDRLAGRRFLASAERELDKEDVFSLIDKYRERILYNSHLDSEKASMSASRYRHMLSKRKYAEERRNYDLKLLEPLPLSLKFLVEPERLLKKDQPQVKVPEKPEKIVNFPYKAANPAEKKSERGWMTNYEYFNDKEVEKFDDPNIRKGATIEFVSRRGWTGSSLQRADMTPNERNLMNSRNENQPQFEEDKYEEEYEWRGRYGTPDPFQPISSVPCYGCGALLHCTDTAVPGYIPSEIFSKRTVPQLMTIECQRCHFLKEFNVALNMKVSQEEYPRLLSMMQGKKGLVILIVDLLDFPGSVWPNIFDVIGHDKTVIVVGNKIDLLPQDSEGFLKHIESCLISEIKKISPPKSNVKCVTLISAKTGYGIEELITCMHYFWKAKGDTYLVGCTNVGKSSVFNALLQSDYCKAQAVDLVKRATVSPWPGTTLNLLKFPIQKPTAWQMVARNKRLEADNDSFKDEITLRQMHLQRSNNPKYAALIGHIGRTFEDSSKFFGVGNVPTYSMEMGFVKSSPDVLDDKDVMYAVSRWCYDTPGVIQPEQIIKHLTTEELVLSIPKHILMPRTFYLHVGETLFVAGLARVDFVQSPTPVRFTVFASEALPVTVCKTEEAKEIYEKFLGTEVLTVPLGGKKRLCEWPGLTLVEKEFNVDGVGCKESAADLVLSSIGWIAITPSTMDPCTLRAWTPEGSGVTLRNPPLLPYAVNIKGRRIYRTPAYRMGNLYSGLTLTDKKIEIMRKRTEDAEKHMQKNGTDENTIEGIQ